MSDKKPTIAASHSFVIPKPPPIAIMEGSHLVKNTEPLIDWRQDGTSWYTIIVDAEDVLPYPRTQEQIFQAVRDLGYAPVSSLADVEYLVWRQNIPVFDEKYRTSLGAFPRIITDVVVERGGGPRFALELGYSYDKGRYTWANGWRHIDWHCIKDDMWTIDFVLCLARRQK